MTFAQSIRRLLDHVFNDVRSRPVSSIPSLAKCVAKSHALALLGGLLVFVPVIATAAPGLSAINLVTTTEYYYPPLDYYFITSRDSDKAALDGISGWTRTDRSFAALSAPVAGTGGLTRYCFDKVAVKATRGSHFYTVLDSDRDALAALSPTNSPAAALPYFEGNDSFAYPPVASGASGSCPAGTQTVYRVFRGNAKFPDNPNHRFTTDLTLYQQFVGLGWDAEGVNFCVPTTIADTSSCPQTAYFPDVSSRNFYVDKKLGW